MSDAKKLKKKKEKKTLNIFDFQKQAGGPGPRNSLPSAPAGELPSGPGQGGGYRRDGRRGGRYNDRPQSAADSSSQWRNNRSNTDRGPRRYDRGDRDRGDRDSGFGRRNTDRGSYGDRGDRGGDRGDRKESRYDDSFSRNMFGSKKQGPSRITPVGRDSFGSRPSRSSRTDNDGPSIDRSSFGSRTPLRPSGSRNFGSSGYRRGGDFEPSSGGFGGSSRPIKQRGYFDGSGSGFGAHLVADLFTNDSAASSDGPDRRVNYAFDRADPPKKTGSSRFSRDDSAPQPARDTMNPWGKSTAPRNQKTPEQIEEEERIKAEREEAARAERQAREAERQRKREEREAEERRIRQEKAEKEAREAHLAGLREDVDTMLNSEAKLLTREHLEVVMPQIEPNSEEAAVLGTALAMTVNAGTVPLNEAIHMIPDSNFDTTFINLLSALATRMGEMDFTAEIQAQGIDVFSLMQNQDNLEHRLVKAGLKCLVGNDETQSQLDQAFANHVSLSELYNVVSGIEDFPDAMIPNVTSYIFEEYFTNQNTEDPAAWFTSGDIFDFLAEKLNGHAEIIDTAVKEWFAGGAKPELLVPMFDRLLRADYIYPREMSAWNADYQNTEAKMTAIMADVLETEDGPITFNEWVMDVETEYEEEEEEEDDDYGGLNYA